MLICANISMLFTGRPLRERIGEAARAGFDTVEVQFPDTRDIAHLQAASSRHDLPVTLINVPHGRDDEVGLAALPGREADFAAAVTQCADQAVRLGARKVNVLAGRPDRGADPAACRQALLANLHQAAETMARHDIGVMIEPVNPVDVPGFFLTSLDAALDVLDAAQHPNLALQFDLYHMAMAEPDLVAALRRAGPYIGHVQFADAPGRHEPGSGAIDFATALQTLRDTGYGGVISAEYRPRADTTAGLGWMKAFRRMIA